MTTTIAQKTPDQPAREKLPPVEGREAAPNANDEAYGPGAAAAAIDPSLLVAAPSHEANPELNGNPGGVAKSVAHWIHQHPQAHKSSFVGFTTYQFVRSAVAAIPYGLSMAGVLAGFTKMESKGAELAAKQGASALTQRFGRGLNGFAAFGPAKWSALIGASFTFYRGTSKLGKWMTEYLFNPKDSEARTAEKVSDLPGEAWRKIKEIAPAESASTPISAVVLGFMTQAFKKPDPDKLKATINGATHSFDWTRENFKALPNWGARFKVMGHSIVHPNAKFIPQAAINTLGYSLFFELGDRLFKDVQIRRGVWAGEHNSIKALKAAPDEYEQGIKESADSKKPKFEDGALQAIPEKHHYAFFNSEPSLGRFIFRRVLPTAVGITAYTAVKMRWASMFGNNFAYDKGISLKEFGKKAWGEGAATSLFFLIPIVAEPCEKFYDAFFERKEKIAQAKDHAKDRVKVAVQELTPEQEKNHNAILERLNAREAVNDCKVSQRA